MKRCGHLLAWLMLWVFVLPGQGMAALVKGAAGTVYGAMPLLFVRNDGQLPASGAAYFSSGPGYAAYFRRDGVYQALRDDMSAEGMDQARLLALRFVGGQPASIDAERPGTARINYYLGNDPKGWRGGVGTYGALRYREVYPGIDILFYGQQRQLEYDVIVAPGADPGNIRLGYDGAEALRITDSGELEIILHGKRLLQKRPAVYQVIGGRKIAVAGSYHLISRKDDGLLAYGFEIGQYDRNHALVIDPVIVYSTYLGGSENDFALDVASDADGNVYVTGYTLSLDFPLSVPLQASIPAAGFETAFISKLDASGSTLVYSTYFGGSDHDIADAIAVDGAGSAYVAGHTHSADFPVLSPCQSAADGQFMDGFVAKLDASGILVYATYLGGSNDDLIHDIAVDDLGNAYLTGETRSQDFPTAAPLFTAASSGNKLDAFVVKLGAAGSSLQYSTYLGGVNRDAGLAVAVDGGGNAYVTGRTESDDFPVTAGAFQGNHNSGFSSAYVSKLSADGQALLYSTYLGGSDDDSAYDIAVDTMGTAYVAGETRSADFPTANPLYVSTDTGNHKDAFVARLNATGSGLIYATFLGGSSRDAAYGLDLDSSGNAYITGTTRSSDFPVTAGAPQPGHAGDEDIFLTVLNPGGTSLTWSTFLGGSNKDQGRGVTVDATGAAYIVGFTRSSDFPVAGALQSTGSSGFHSAVVTKLQ